MNAHAVFHIAMGMLIGTLIIIRPLWKTVKQRGPYATVLKRAGAVIYGCAAWAIAPSLLRGLGAPDGFCDGWWMNLCMGYPLINHYVDGGMLIGEGLITLQVMAHYLILMTVLWMLNRQRPQDPHQCPQP